jgi:hypothetical protein
LKALFTAIYSHFDAGGDFKTNLTGGLHHGHASQGTAFPYGTVSLVSSPTDFLLEGQTIELPLIQFSIFDQDTDATTALTLYDNLKTMFDFATIAVSGYGYVKFERVNTVDLYDPEDHVWQYSVDYRVTLIKD